MFSRVHKFSVTNQTNTELSVECQLRESLKRVTLPANATQKFKDKKAKEIQLEIFLNTSPTTRVYVHQALKITDGQVFVVAQRDVDKALADNNAKSVTASHTSGSTKKTKRSSSTTGKESSTGAAAAAAVVITAPESWLHLFPEGKIDDDVDTSVVKSALLKFGTAKQLFGGISKSTLHALLDASLEEIDLDDTGLVSPAELDRALDGATLEAWLRELVQSAKAADGGAASGSPLLSRNASTKHSSPPVGTPSPPASKSPSPPAAAPAVTAPASAPAGRPESPATTTPVAVAASAAPSTTAPASLASSTSSRVVGNAQVSTNKIIPPQDLVFCDGHTAPIVLGQGGFGIVTKMTWNSGPFDVAVKSLLETKDDPTGKVRKMFEAECGLQANLAHPHVLELYGLVVDGPALQIVMPLLASSLFDVIHVKHRQLSWSERARIASEIGAGLNYLHTRSPPILHRDLKSPNVMLTNRDDVKLVDFGLAQVKTAVKSIKSSVSTSGAQADVNNSVGTIQWNAPELLKLRPSYATASDVYAFGATAFEIAAYELPFAGLHPAAITQAVKNGERPKIPATVPESFAAAIAKCWAQDAAARPSALDAVKMFRTLIDQLENTPVAAAASAAAPTPETPAADAAMSALQLASKAPQLQVDDNW